MKTCIPGGSVSTVKMPPSWFTISAEMYFSRPSSTRMRLVQGSYPGLETETRCVPGANEKSRGVIHLGLFSPSMEICAPLTFDSTTRRPLPGINPVSLVRLVPCTWVMALLGVMTDVGWIATAAEFPPPRAPAGVRGTSGACSSRLVPALADSSLWFERSSRGTGWTSVGFFTGGVCTGAVVTLQI